MERLKQEKFNGEITAAIVDYVKMLVRSRLKSRPIPGLELDDAIQEALEKVVLHLPKFDPEKCSLAGFIAVIVQSRLRQCYHYQTAKKRNGAPCLTMEEAERYSPFDSSYMDRAYSTVRFKLDLLHFAPLDEEEAQVVKMLYHGLTRREVARALKMPPTKLNWIIEVAGDKYLQGLFYGTEALPRN